MKKFLHIFLLMLIPVLSGCGEDSSQSDAQIRLLEIYDCAENTIRNEGNYPKTLELYLSFIREAQNDPALEAQLVKAYVSVAVIYGSFNDIDNAIVYNRLAYSLARKTGDSRFAELALTNLAQSYLDKHYYDEASAIADSLLALDPAKSRTRLFHHSILRGEIALDLDRDAEALTYFRRADSIAMTEGLSRYEQSAPLELIACYYEKAGMPDSQLVYLDQVWALVDADKDPHPKAECARKLMEFHTVHGNLEEARHFQNKYLELTNSLVNLQKFLSVNANHQQIQIDSKGNEINNLNRRASYHRTIIIVIAALLTIAIAFIILTIFQKRSLDAAYKALFDKNQRLMGLSSQPHSADSADSESPADSESSKSSDADTDPREEERNRLLYERIVRSMEQTHDYLNPEFSLSNIVSMAGSNVAYVSKVIKRYSGQNVPSFINEYRIREACRRILDDTNFGNITFAAIGESVGFSTQASFNRAFKKVTGITPSRYQQMVADGRKNG